MAHENHDEENGPQLFKHYSAGPVPAPDPMKALRAEVERLEASIRFWQTNATNTYRDNARLTRRIALADAVCAMAENFEMIPTPTWGMRMIDAVEAYRASAQDAPESHLLAAARKQDADPDRIRTPRDVQELYDTDAPDTAREGGSDA